MTSNTKKAAIVLALAAASFPTIAFAQGATFNDVVRDKRGNVVRDNRNGCVRTKWLEATDQCSGAPVARISGNAYLVFFDFDKSTLTREAKNIVAKAARDSAGANGVSVVGHADRSGTDGYNLRLSQRRAAAVKQQLIRDGVPAGKITTAAKGERDPLVPTQDGVREPQNRRAEISFY